MGYDEKEELISYGEKEELIIDAFGAFLEQSDRAPNTVADSSKLPFPKEEIKAALLQGFFSTDSNEMRGLFKSILITILPYFQPGVGSKDVGGLGLEGLDIINLDHDEMQALIKNISESSKEGKEWLAKAHAESEYYMQKLSDAERMLDENKD